MNDNTLIAIVIFIFIGGCCSLNYMNLKHERELLKSGFILKEDNRFSSPKWRKAEDINK